MMPWTIPRLADGRWVFRWGDVPRPESPPITVRVVRTRDGTLFYRNPDDSWCNESHAGKTRTFHAGTSWHSLLKYNGPLTDATCDLEDTKMDQPRITKLIAQRGDGGALKSITLHQPGDVIYVISKGGMIFAYEVQDDGGFIKVDLLLALDTETSGG